MKPLLFCLALSLTGCATTLYRDGKPIARFQSDITTGDYKDGETHFTFAKMNNSRPTREAGKIIGAVASDIASLAVPGSGAVPAVVKGSSIVLPHVVNTLSKPGDN